MRYKGKSKYIDEKNIAIEDFVYYCKNAKFIVTDSFHGICFSIIYEKPFISIVNAWRGIARYKIFEELMLKNYIVDSIEQIYNMEDFNFSIDYSMVKEKLIEEQPKVYKWLKDKLDMEIGNASESDLLYDYLYQKNLMQVNKGFKKIF